MRAPSEISAGTWWRFSKYQLRDGYISPARGARLETYDPWAAYWESREKRLAPPYQSLLDLLRAVKWTDPGGGDSRLVRPGAPELLRPEVVQQLLGWCSTHGLLGILPQRALLVTLAPRFQPVTQGNPKGSTRQLRLVQQEFVRTSTEWVVNERKDVPVPMRSRQDWAALKGRPGPLVFEPGWNRPRVILQDLTGRGLIEEPLRKTWARFFPGVSRSADEYSWPAPLSPAFWRLYTEPFDDFLWAMITFRSILHDLERAGRSPKFDVRNEGRAGLHALLTSVSPVLDRGKGHEWKQRSVSMSLLGSFAMMALLDLTEGWRVHECSVCKRAFVSDAWQARYCSARCRHTAQKRAFRVKKMRLERQRAKASPQSSGSS